MRGAIRRAIIAIVVAGPLWQASAMGEVAKRVVGCGEECISLLCHFYGITMSDDVILRALSPNESGECTLLALDNAIRAIGLGSRPFRGTVDDLFKIRDPMILHLQRRKADKVGHFIVVCWSEYTQELIGYDPALSGVSNPLTREMLQGLWTGVGVIVYRTPAYSPYRIILCTLCGAVLAGMALARARQWSLQRRR
jgi:ABC-type bacteriocin/lantibiotic exporter with double-glycine peptidase domain